MNHLKALIKAAGKKCYTVVVGKLNDPKLSNFSEISIFVLVACPFNSLIDSHGFNKDVITPFELELALDPYVQIMCDCDMCVCVCVCVYLISPCFIIVSHYHFPVLQPKHQNSTRSWTGEYTTDFGKVLKSLTTRDERKVNVEDDPDAHEFGVRYSTITRQLEPAIALNANPESDGKHALVPLETALTANPTESAVAFMAHRSFRGLDLSENADGPAEIEQGLSGIARQYESDGQGLKANTVSTSIADTNTPVDPDVESDVDAESDSVSASESDSDADQPVSYP
jgi:diphthamide biosynthesis protein 2